MFKNNAKKKKQLGMPYGTACNRLRKLVLFHLARKLKLTVCFRCGKEIESVEEFSVDHREPWLDGDADKFWSMENVVFSHLVCNCRVRRSPKSRAKHGSNTRYTHNRCRCLRCVEAHREYQREYRRKHG